MPTNDANQSISRVIAYAVASAKEHGADHVGQSQKAISAVLTVRPDLNVSEAHKLVELVTLRTRG